MSERSADWVVDSRTFFNSFIFSIGSVARISVDFWILKRHGYLETRFLACLTAFQSFSEELYAFALDSQYAFFFTLVISRPFSAQVSLNSSQLFFVSFFFQVFLSLLALIWAPLHPLSNTGTNLGQSFALRVETSIALSIVFTREITFSSSSSVVFDKVSNILAGPSFRVFNIAVLSIFKSRRWESWGLSNVCEFTITGSIGGQSHSQTFLLYRKR